MCMIGRCNARMTDEEEARGSSTAKFRRSNPGFSESKDIDAASIRDSSIFERDKKRANVKCTYIESGGSRPRLS